ncbi:MAG: 2-oxoacid:acceptor oxidoreductase family protein, partial [Akkermansia sp.]|nr:2-oxoacid:acceptor oxidoreductase family protein [Akkermansia sp.]
LAEAAAIHERKESLMGCAYGSEARGTFTKSEVIIDEKRIYFPEVLQPDYVIALHQVAYNRYVKTLGKETCLLYDSDTVKAEESDAKQLGIPFTSISDQAGAANGQNMVALGVLAGALGIVGKEALDTLIAEKFASKPNVVERNQTAISLGMEAGKNLAL